MSILGTPHSDISLNLISLYTIDHDNYAAREILLLDVMKYSVIRCKCIATINP